MCLPRRFERETSDYPSLLLWRNLQKRLQGTNERPASVSQTSHWHRPRCSIRISERRVTADREALILRKMSKTGNAEIRVPGYWRAFPKARVQWLSAYLRADGRYHEKRLIERYRLAVKAVSAKLHEKATEQGIVAHDVGKVFFEYFVDKTVWMDIYKAVARIGLAPDWPWKELPDSKDMSEGSSLTYRSWRVENNLPVPETPVADPTAATAQQAQLPR
ncbi:hypothetical protein BFJ72_g2738 [Fusarium proliferatum]|uniref:Uncharacterized protein n=1 Tax=Gibberella intermedia TaxID=948311 RepID=A0A420TZQ3_GIBIN|nr:hypothetical protein BFJ72_g2738 [Fusarium proliferatum]